MNPAKSQIGKSGTVLGLASVGLTLYWALTYSGPYRHLAELQLKWIGVYSRELTAMVVILGFPGIALGIRFVLRGAERSVPVAPAVMAPASVVTNTLEGSWLSYLRYTFLLVLFGLGGWTYYNGTHAGSLQQLQAVDFENGKMQVRLVYADVRGHLSGSYLAKDHYLYIPMASEANKAAPVQLVVGVDENRMRDYMRREADGRFTVRGVVDRGLAGDVKYAFEKNGVTVAESCWLVHAGREPSSDRTFGVVLIGVGIASAAGIFGLESYRKKKRNAARPLPAAA